MTTPEAVAAYLASIGHKAGGFGYVEITYDEEAAAKAATEYYTAANGKKYPLIAFTFTYTATEASGKQQKGTFTDYYYFVHKRQARKHTPPCPVFSKTRRGRMLSLCFFNCVANV